MDSRGRPLTPLGGKELVAVVFRKKKLSGSEMLRAIGKYEHRCEERTEKLMPKWGKKAPQCYEHLGQVLAYADMIGSCTYGCPGPSRDDHAVLYLAARASSFGRAALRLAKMGFYDEALNIVRSVGEIANLFALFAADPNTVEEWRKSDRKYRREHLGPAKIRERIVALNQEPVMDQDTYRDLCEISTHPVPQLRPQQFNHAEKSMTGGMYVQEAGFLVVLNELAAAAAFLVVYATYVCNVPKEARKPIFTACSTCLKFTGSVHVANVAEILKARPGMAQIP